MRLPLCLMALGLAMLAFSLVAGNPAGSWQKDLGTALGYNIAGAFIGFAVCEITRER